MEWMIICVIVGLSGFFIGFCVRGNNDNRQNIRDEVLINNSNNRQNEIEEVLINTNSELISFQNNIEIPQTTSQIKSTDKKKKIIKPIRRRRLYIRQLKLIRTKKLNILRSLKNINKQKEKQIYLCEKQKKINLENKKIIQEKKKLAIEENKALDNIMHTVSIINLKMNFNGETKTFMNQNSPRLDMLNNEIKNKDEI